MLRASLAILGRFAVCDMRWTVVDVIKAVDKKATGAGSQCERLNSFLALSIVTDPKPRKICPWHYREENKQGRKTRISFLHSWYLHLIAASPAAG